MPYLISDDRRLALLIRHRIPAHSQFAIPLFHHHMRGHCRRRFFNVGDGDVHYFAKAIHKEQKIGNPNLAIAIQVIF